MRCAISDPSNGCFNFAVSILKLSWLVVNLLSPSLHSLSVFLVVILLSHILKLVIKCLFG